MTDYFALLQEPRRPWIDGERLKSKFLTRSGSVHPDRCHDAPDAEKQRVQDQYTELNAAYRCLQDPKDRLRHLLELETGARPAQVHSIPQQTADWFIQISQICRETDALLADKQKQTSPLLLAGLFKKGLALTDQLQQLQQQLATHRSSQLERLKSFNQAWETAPDPGSPMRARHLPLDQLEEIYRTISYLDRWSAQVQERLVQLAV